MASQGPECGQGAGQALGHGVEGAGAGGGEVRGCQERGQGIEVEGAERGGGRERRIDRVGPDGPRVRLRGTGCRVVRPQPDGSRRIAAGAWLLSGVPAG